VCDPQNQKHICKIMLYLVFASGFPIKILHCFIVSRVLTMWPNHRGEHIRGGIVVPFLIDLTTVVLNVVPLVTWFRDGKTGKVKEDYYARRPITCTRSAGKYDPSSCVLRIFMFRIILISFRLKRKYNGYIY